MPPSTPPPPPPRAYSFRALPPSFKVPLEIAFKQPPRNCFHQRTLSLTSCHPWAASTPFNYSLAYLDLLVENIRSQDHCQVLLRHTVAHFLQAQKTADTQHLKTSQDQNGCRRQHITVAAAGLTDYTARRQRRGRQRKECILTHPPHPPEPGLNAATTPP